MLSLALNIAIGEWGPSKVGCGPLFGLKSDISRGPSCAIFDTLHCKKAAGVQVLTHAPPQTCPVVSRSPSGACQQTGGACRPTSEPRQAPPWYRAAFLAPTMLIMDSPG